jgi:hypothetical protein
VTADDKMMDEKDKVRTMVVQLRNRVTGAICQIKHGNSVTWLNYLKQQYAASGEYLHLHGYSDLCC